MIPTTIIYNPPYNMSNSSYTTKCIESPDFYDIRTKLLKNEEMNDSEIERVNDCISKKQEESNKKIWITFAIVIGLFIGILIVFMIGW